MSDAAGITGRCACGAIRYMLRSHPFDAGYCHCRICQLSSGAPVMAFATVPIGDYCVTQGERRMHRSSEVGTRGFCVGCGTQLTMQVTHQPDTIDFTIASLDRPEEVIPGFHIWHASRISWFETADALPRHDRFRDGTAGPTGIAASGASLDG